MLPWDKVPWESVGGGLVFLTAMVLAALGAKRGVTPAPTAPAASQTIAVTGDVLVLKSLELMTQELGALAGTVIALRKGIEAHGSRIVSHQEVIEESVRVAQGLAERADRTAREITNLQSQIKELKDELWRQAEREDMRRRDR